MTTEELLKQLYDASLVGNAPEVLSLTNQGLAQGLGPESLLYEAGAVNRLGSVPANAVL